MADLYGALGLQKNAGMDDIKKAYRKEALAKHPDRGGNKEEFQKLQAAYEILSDPEKRAHYDATGQIPQEGGGPQGGGMPPDLAAMFGGMFGSGFQGGGPGFPGMPGGMPFPFFGGMNQQQTVRPARGPNKIHEIGLSLADLYSGKTFKLNMKREVLCGRCGGKGGTRVEKCGQCGGQGHRMRGIQMGPIMTMAHEQCGACSASGQKVLDECGECRGKKVLERESFLDVNVEPGMQEGDRLTFVGQCSESPQFEKPGDVILIIRASTTDSEEWVRQGADLTYTVTLSVAEMLMGWQRVLQGHPSGKELPIAWTGGILREGEIVVLKGLGMPNRGSGGKGDLRLVCKTTGHQSGLSEEQRSALKLVWPDWKEVSIDGSNIPVRHG